MLYSCIAITKTPLAGRKIKTLFLLNMPFFLTYMELLTMPLSRHGVTHPCVSEWGGMLNWRTDIYKVLGEELKFEVTRENLV